MNVRLRFVSWPFASGILAACSLLASCGSVEPLRELSRKEQAYFTRLADRLEGNRVAFHEGLRNLWNTDGLKEEATFQRILLHSSAKLEFARLFPAGAPADGDALKSPEFTVAAGRLIEGERAILQKLESETAAVDARIADVLGLYDALTEASRELVQNQAKLSDYLEQSWLERLVTDVKGLDADALKRLGDQLKALRESVKS